MVEAINYHTGVENAWSNVATFIPKLIVFLIILIIGYLIAKAISQDPDQGAAEGRLRPAGRTRRSQEGAGVQPVRRRRDPGQDRVLRDHAVRALDRVRGVRHQPDQRSTCTR